MDALLRKRDGLVWKIDALKTIVDQHPVTAIDQIGAQQQLKRMSDFREKNDELLDEILEICVDKVQTSSATAAYGVEQQRLDDIERALIMILATFPTSASVTAGTSSASGMADIKLPKIEIPPFKGETQEWLSFQDLFVSSIHNNSKLSGSQKLQYLKGLLQGEPASLVKDIQVTDANYATAWDVLKDRYEVKRDIIRSHFDRLLTVQNVQQANPILLRKIGDSTSECDRALDVLKLTPEQKWDSLIIHIMSRKLDSESRVDWEKKLASNEIPTIKKFTDFILAQARATAAGGMKPKPTIPSKGNGQEKKQVNFSSQGKFDNKSCSMCHENHPLYKCGKFTKCSTDERWAFVKKARLCFNCFRAGHSTTDCTSSYSCRSCQKKHNTLLHQTRTSSEKEKSEDKKEEEANIASNFSHSGESSSQVLLSTALICVKDSQNQVQLCRALLDDGSQGSFVTAKCASRLGLKRMNKVTNVVGVGGIDAGRTTHCVQLMFTSHYKQNKQFTVQAHIKEKLTGSLPIFPVQQRTWPHIQTLQLADPKFYEPNKIDILLGRDVYDDIVLSKRRKGPAGTPTARHTALGWILGGPTHVQPIGSHLHTLHVCCDLDATLQKFWELEEIPSNKELSPDEKLCEQHFLQTHERELDGRFVVNLPFKKNVKPLGDSRDQALRRLQQGERSRSQHPEKQKEYNGVLQEYLDLHHMEKVPADELRKKENVYFIPHHAVYKPTSTTTKVRVVFDASAKASNGVSLNENLLTGPKLQEDLFKILIRFRTHRVAFTADVAKMYRQVNLKHEDCDFQRILWRKFPTEPVQEYRLTTATFGTAAAPYLAIKCLQQLAVEEIEKNQVSRTLASSTQHYGTRAAVRILTDFYVDDLMSGAESEKEAIQIKDELLRILDGGKMQLRKWSSNSNAFLASLPKEFRETKFPLRIDEDETVKTLGLTWSPATDVFSISVVMPPSRQIITKRTLLSDLAKTFDPLGLLSPATIKAKLIFQALWKEKQEWDDPIPENYKQEWLQYLEDFPAYNKINIPRCVIVPDCNYELHGFSDASQVAYAACIYLRSYPKIGPAHSTLVAAKTKVAPIKYVSVAKLELCGAALLASLMQVVRSCINLQIKKTVYWTDSTIVLAWIASPSQRWKIFVANRVAKIQEKSEAEQWNHVRGEENPADCASRGINPSELKSHNLWWHGPNWLQTSSLPTTEAPPDEAAEPEILEEEKKTVCVNITTESQDVLGKFSSLLRLQKATAFVIRCIRLKSFKKARDAGTFTVSEWNNALNYWIKEVQNESFGTTISALKKKKTIPKCNEQLKSFAPFIDANGMLRVGGRLQNSELSADRKHPILLPKKNHLTILIVQHYHRTYLHAGNQLLLSTLQGRFWILGARDIIRSLIRKCTTCFRVRAETAQQMMGNLPAPRVLQTRPFQQVGVDLCGPFTLLSKTGRGQKTYKFYVAVFVCFVVRAVHLELVSDLTTDGFLAAFRRFVSRRGLCSDIYSDCGSNFVGADAELKIYMQNIQASTLGNSLKDALAKDGVTWHFNPPSAPHQGGLWEAGVKSFKYHLKRIVGGHTLSMEEMLTILAQIEACLNSRPLTALSPDPQDLTALTPGHFLIGDSLLAIPEPDVTNLQENRLSRWQRTQKLYQHFWNRWSSEYLSRLQQRPKWWAQKKNVEIGDLVLIKDERYPSLKWKLGRVEELFPGKDDLVRVASVKTTDGTYKRPIVKLCPLPLDKDE